MNSPSHTPLQTCTYYIDPHTRVTYASEPPRPHHSTPLAHATMYCSYCGCQDSRCLDTQMTKQGLRDDLRHHEDQDKNGNMNDGDNVGQHSPGSTQSCSFYAYHNGDHEDEDADVHNEDLWRSAASHPIPPHTYAVGQDKERNKKDRHDSKNQSHTAVASALSVAYYPRTMKDGDNVGVHGAGTTPSRSPYTCHHGVYGDEEDEDTDNANPTRSGLSFAISPYTYAVG